MHGIQQHIPRPLRHRKNQTVDILKNFPKIHRDFLGFFSV